MAGEHSGKGGYQQIRDTDSWGVPGTVSPTQQGEKKGEYNRRHEEGLECGQGMSRLGRTGSSR